MKKEQAMVAAFHFKAGATINEQPRTISQKDAFLRIALISEELIELGMAFGIKVNIQVDQKIDGENQTNSERLAETADAIGDILYVVLGTAVCCGIDIEPIFHEIHRSNMSKFVDGHRRADGKWCKGPSYSPADLAPILAAQSQG
jgi:predicted HAD superfamily Cof-like phosphohydrolase